jgi:excisionase family DNA binding protein
MKPPSDEDEVGMSVKEAARILGVAARTVYRLCESGELPHYRIGRRVTITPRQLKLYRKHASHFKTGPQFTHLQ